MLCFSVSGVFKEGEYVQPAPPRCCTALSSFQAPSHQNSSFQILPFHSTPSPHPHQPSVFPQTTQVLTASMSALPTLGIRDTGCGFWWLPYQILTQNLGYYLTSQFLHNIHLFGNGEKCIP